MKKIFKYSMAAITVGVLAIGLYLSANTYSPKEEAIKAMKGSENVSVVRGDNIFFNPLKDEKNEGVIIYPGAFVEPESYACLALALAERGYKTIVADMFMNLPIMEAYSADKIIADNPDIDHWMIGGHSLGGVMAAKYAKEHPKKIKGLALMAAYTTEKADLSRSEIEVVAIYGTKDGVINKKAFEKNSIYLPENTKTVPIGGGNHGQFGNYGNQKGDGTPSLTAKEQQRITVISIEEILENIK